MAITPGEANAARPATETPEQAQRREREEAARRRQERLAKIRTEVRIFPTPIVGDACDPQVYRTLLIPFPENSGRGRHPHRGLVNRLNDACGYHALCAYEALRDGNMKAGDVLAVIEAASQASRGDALLRLGREQRERLEITSHTADQIAKRLYPAADSVADAHISLVRLLHRTAQRADAMLQASDEAMRIVDQHKVCTKADLDEAEDVLQAAFRKKAGEIDRVDLVRITVAANINPGVVWPQHHDDMPTLELARFARWLMLDADRPLNRRYAKIESHLVPVGQLILDPVDVEFGNEDGFNAVFLIRDLLRAALPDEAMSNLIQAQESDGDFVVGRGKVRDRRRDP